MRNNCEHLVGVDYDELLKLRFERFRSIELSKKLLKEKCKNHNISLTEDVIYEKAKGLSSAIDSALNFWNIKGQNLNARILSRYYSLLQLTIAEEVASVETNADLKQVQKHTEQGHGLTTFSTNKTGDILNDYCCYIRQDGHFYNYLKFLNVEDVASFSSGKKIKQVDDTNQKLLISLSDLFCRIPELQTVIEDYTGLLPLVLHFGYDSIVTARNEEKIRDRILNETGKLVVEIPKENCSKINTFVSIYPSSDNMTLEYIRSLDTPFTDFEMIEDSNISGKYISCKFLHDNRGVWWDYISAYKSNYTPTSYIVPLFGKINDIILLNYMLLYTLSIIVRYLPDMWYEISNGKYNNIGRLIDYYISIYDHVIPHQMLERITEKVLHISMPGGFDSLV